MAALNFPPNPTLGQTYSNTGRTYKWNGVTWAATTVSTPTSAPVFVSASPPANPINGSLWYSTISSNLNIYYKDQNGGQWVSVVPFPTDSIDQNGGVFEGAIYAQYDIPNNPAAFVTVGWVNGTVTAYLQDNGYVRSGAGVTINNDSEISLIDCGTLS
jgi:hypothetical protein